MVRKTAAERRRALNEFMRLRDLKPKTWAERAGVSPNTLYNFVNKRSDSLSQQTLEKLAVAEGVTVAEIIGESPVASPTLNVPILIKGEVQAGIWREAIEWPPDDQYPIYMPAIANVNPNSYGLIVRGNSMNRLYRDGTVLICTRFDQYNGQLLDGLKVHIQRRNKNGLVEATIKELERDQRGKWWLWPRSTDPEFQAPLPLPESTDDHDGDEAEKVDICGVVDFAVTPQR